MHLRSYLDSATKILAAYDGSIPFAAYLKGFFRVNKKYGSKDRKMIGNLCYCYFRLGNAFRTETMDEQLLIAQFLCSSSSNPFLEQMKPEWNENIDRPAGEKFELLGTSENVFPFADELSGEIDLQLFDKSFIVQPDLFLRIRPGKQTEVLRKLTAANVRFQNESENCLRLPIATKVDEILELDAEVVVQDYNSQKVFQFSELQTISYHGAAKVWDCCAASGGKSILLIDAFPNVQLTASDIRESILSNLNKRFARAGIKNYKSFVADVSNSKFKMQNAKFDLIVCDAPCSGSGTWGRTPEQMMSFTKNKIDYYADLQKKIARNASQALQSGGYFLYITCSVFKKENEGVVDFLQQETQLKLVAHQYLKGYSIKADTLFAALFRL